MVYSRLVEQSHHNKTHRRRLKTMSDNIMQLNKDLIEHDLKNLFIPLLSRSLLISFAVYKKNSTHN